MTTPPPSGAFLDKIFGLKGKNVFLTGASSGIGEGWAFTLAAAGASSLALVARRTDKLTRVANQLRAEFPTLKVAVVSCDVSNGESIKKAFDDGEGQIGGSRVFDVIINNAGVGPAAPVMEATAKSMDETMAINVRGPFLIAQEASRRLIKVGKSGSIINVASIYGLRVGFNNAVYATTKAALIQLTKALAIELLGKNIRVNCIAPGYYRSEMTAEFYDSPAGKKYLQTKVPSKRLGRLEELNGALLLLASDASSNMTGAVVVVDGGHSTSSL